jgi:hypothetical protein
MKNLKIISALFVLLCANVAWSSDITLQPGKQDESTPAVSGEWQRFTVTDHKRIHMDCDDQSSIASWDYGDRWQACRYLTGSFIKSSTEKSELLTRFNELSRYMKFNDLSFDNEISVNMEVSPLCKAKQKSPSKVKATCEDGTRLYFELQKCIHDPKRKVRQEIKKLESAMHQASQAQNFELAMTFRDRVSALKAQNGE